MGALKPRALLTLALVFLLTLPTPYSRVHAQEEEDIDALFSDEEFEGDMMPGTYEPAFEPPPPPPPPDAGPDFSPPAGLPPPDESMRRFPTPVNSGGNNGGGSTARSSGPKTIPRVKPAQKPAKTKKPDISEASIEDITNENYPDLIESFDYPNADITDVIQAMSQLTGKNFIIDPGVRGKISIIAPSQITVAEAWKAFLAALAVNQLTVVPYGKFLKVKSTRLAQRDSIETYSGDYYPNSDILITRIVHLKHTSAEEVNRRLKILQSRDGEITAYEPTNTLIITDFGSNVERIMKIIKEIDRPGFEEQLEVIPIRYARAKDLADLINQIINKDTSIGRPSTGAPPFGAGVPRFRARPGAPGSSTPEELSIVTPDERTNAIIVVGNQAGINKVRNLVKKLDYKLDPAEAGGVFVYHVKFGDAEKLAQTLSGIAQGTTTPSGAPSGGPSGVGTFPRPGMAVSPLSQQSIFGGDVKITADKNTNSLVITASKVDYEKVLSILSQLDIPKDQVFVEAIIMEMNSMRNDSWQPNYYGFSDEGKGIGRSGFVTTDIGKILNPATDSGVILGFGSNKTVEVDIGGRTLTVPNLIAFINLIQSVTETNVLSTPRILAQDNEEAEIEVGDKMPVGIDQNVTSTGLTSMTPRFEDATIKLKITPSIRPDSEIVRLKVEQHVKQLSKKVIPAENLAKNAAGVSTRLIKSNITVNNGDTAVLGGLVRDEDTVEEKKIPLLGDIPILGWLFKSKRVETNKVNLVVFLTPRIIRNVTDSHQNLTKTVNDRIDWIKKNFSGRDPYGSDIDKLPRTSKADDDDKSRAATPVVPTKKE